MKTKKLLSVTLSILFTLSFVSADKKDIYKQVRKNQALINDVYRHLITNYVDDIDLDAFTKMSINNMLYDLDPYTVYLENEEKSGIEMLTKGKYGGVGIQIGNREKILTVISPMENSPAKRAGIISGDKIIKIDNQDTEDLNMNDAAKLIRGKKGSIVTLSIQRYGESELIDYNLTREDIKVKDISFSGMLNNQTGYIRLTRFSRNSDKEMEKALEDLLDQNMTGLILDLRDNPGGLLNAAVNILDLFIEKGEMLVWTEGKTQKSKRKYQSKYDPIVPNDINVTVLVNQGSASASEIVAGALQDLDRGVVIGRSTFGKGLVQTVFKIDRDRSLKITTAKYFIPSGRLIQKPGYLPVDILADSTEQDSIFFTRGGREVSGAGGITPDHEVILNQVAPILSASWRQGLFFNYVQKHKVDYDSLSTVESDTLIMKNFEDFIYSSDLDVFMKGESNYLDMKDMLIELDSTNLQIKGAVDILDAYFEEIAITQFEREEENLHHWLMVEFANYFHGNDGRVKKSATKDKDILKALSILQNPVVYDKVFLPQLENYNSLNEE
ncbi:MAG: S41 family peptidase [Candidatus Marinimicrobia bacterium]|jgi:carboxyl-terminal processing protease|nr:S41 family peptidase [Candidatus Neomarinimicrobiota bacterium]MBT3502277.1 S41 family peptidase [Candidatus Neomarinimicrobiota bacterium]MBT3840355.1 S41 family peptidase [Candidatus Neomarinimicrobiota bacterium]MBT3998525.1 S41 family peptidase [Candidatus Neomarinimicrobiota bacterium]MBT4578987.1 S41 family peptidase [Candidatus Neomarinimicrobiota bacterium]